jgi:hypothetical protein
MPDNKDASQSIVSTVHSNTRLTCAEYSCALVPSCSNQLATRPVSTAALLNHEPGIHYPNTYYTKDTTSREATSFRRIDINAAVFNLSLLFFFFAFGYTFLFPLLSTQSELAADLRTGRINPFPI